MAAAGTLSYDPLDLADDPYPTYRRLRDEAPLYVGSCAAGPFWALSRFDDVREAAQDWRAFSSAQGNDLDDTGDLFGPAPAMDLCDPPTHTRQREVLKAVFAPRAVASELRPLARRKVVAALDALRDRDVVDLAEDLAYPLPAAVVGELLGLPSQDRDLLRAWHAATLERTPGRRELPTRAVQARDELWAYLREALADRRTRPREDILGLLAQAEADGLLSADEALANAFFVFDAGIVSTAALIASAFLHLHDHPDQQRLLWDTPALIPGAVEELLRFDAPFQWFTRVASRDVATRAGTIPEGARVVLIWASANRDERRWEEPDRLVVTRPPRQHLTFSAGVHHCLAAPLARLEIRILLEELTARLVGYALLGPPVRRITPSERTIVHLPARMVWA